MSIKTNLHDQHADVKALHGVLESLRAQYKVFYDLVSQVGDRMKARSYDAQDLTDLGFLSSKIEVMLEEWRKDSKARREFADRLLCLAMMEAAQANPNAAADKSIGTLASGSPDVHYEINPPEPGTEGHALLAEWLGIPSNANPVVKVSWSELSKLVTSLAEEGKPLPPGIGKPWPVYKVRYYARGNKPKAHQGF